MNKIILFILLASYAISAQENKSIHQSDNEYYSNNLQFVKSYITSKSLPVKKTSRNQILTKTVFGFLPWWEYLAGTHQNIRYDLLTHIAISFFDTDGDGNITDPPAWPWNDLIDSARSNNIKLIMVVSNFQSGQIHKLLTDQSSQQKLFNNILQKIIVNSFDGVNVDFENLLSGDEGSVINGFMKSLNNFIKSKYPLAEVSFDSPIVKSGSWDFKGLADACDYLFIMGYDFYGSWSSTTGPSSPLIGNIYGLTYSFNNYYSSVPPQQLILGVPYYGNYWRTNSNDAYANVTPYDSTKAKNNWMKPALRYKEIISQYASNPSNENKWDSVSQTPWLRWGQDTLWNQIWYDDGNSLALKYDLSFSKNLKGIGIWALGYDDARSELWNLIEKKFAKTTSVDENVSSIPSRIELHQNYPNPFNPTTTIKYLIPNVERDLSRSNQSELKSALQVSLKVYDILGREVATLVDKVQSAGIYSSTFSTLHSTLPSGIYIYSLNANGFIQSKKMVLLR